MTDSIYRNSFVFEKHGKAFSTYITLCIRNYRNEKGVKELHHIFPRCMEQINKSTGKRKQNDSRWNLVYLKYEDHKLAHDLLAEAIDYKPLFQAACLMNRKPMFGKDNPHYGNGYKLRGEKSPMYKIPRTDEVRTKISLSLLGKMTGENHPMFGKGYKLIGENNGMWQRKHSEETIRLMKSKATDRHKQECEHCKQQADPGNYSRWHGDNCKHNPNSPRFKNINSL